MVRRLVGYPMSMALDDNLQHLLAEPNSPHSNQIKRIKERIAELAAIETALHRTSALLANYWDYKEKYAKD